uniref:Uncharacterized protein n=2 Tax=Anguilla anguilla TaxID=7936 RepID=A0A0E9PCJ6_ANGAN
MKILYKKHQRSDPLHFKNQGSRYWDWMETTMKQLHLSQATAITPYLCGLPLSIPPPSKRHHPDLPQPSETGDEREERQMSNKRMRGNRRKGETEAQEK